MSASAGGGSNQTWSDWVFYAIMIALIVALVRGWPVAREHALSKGWRVFGTPSPTVSAEAMPTPKPAEKAKKELVEIKLGEFPRRGTKLKVAVDIKNCNQTMCYPVRDKDGKELGLTFSVDTPWWFKEHKKEILIMAFPICLNHKPDPDRATTAGFLSGAKLNSPYFVAFRYWSQMHEFPDNHVDVWIEFGKED